MLNWLFVDLNSYFASVEQQTRPELRGRPVGVVPMMADTTCCIAASYEAKAFGVKTGTIVADAKKMCPGIVFVEAGHRKYVEYHDRIMEAVESCLPVTEVMSIDEAACRLTGRDQKLENAIALAHEVKQKILQVGEVLTCSIGLSVSRFLSKVASDMQKPDGLVVLQQDDLPHKLLHLKPRDLPGIGFNMERRLQEHGITTMRHLYDLSVQDMRHIWGGINGERYHKWLRGADLDYFTNEEPKTIGHSHVLAPKFRTENGAYAVAEKLLHKAAFRLRKAGLWARAMSLSIRYTDRTRWGEFLHMHECQDTHSLNRAFLQLWRMRPSAELAKIAAQLRFRPPTPMKISITLSDFISHKEKNLSFFDEPKKHAASEVMDKINSKHGRHVIYLADMHEALESAPSRIAFSSIPKYDVD